MTPQLPLLARRFAVALLSSVALAVSVGTVPAAALPHAPTTPTGFPQAIEQPAPYVPNSSCDPRAKPGTVKLAKLLKRTYPNSGYGISRACGVVPNSEHLEGRAVDWMNTSRTATKAAQAKVVLRWLMATDRAGHPAANLHRLGIMYIIWDNRIWSAHSPEQGWRSYRNCGNRPQRSLDTVCHRDHMHISLSWEGAMGRTSFWTKSVARRDYGPCRAADLSWAPQYTRANFTPCARYGRPVSPAGASAVRRALTTYSGIVLRQGARGAAVKAVQRAVKTTADGDFGPQTKAAVATWQRAHHLTGSGAVTATTWRALLRATR